jgi:hypothetical protein
MAILFILTHLSPPIFVTSALAPEVTSKLRIRLYRHGANLTIATETQKLGFNCFFQNIHHQYRRSMS